MGYDPNIHHRRSIRLKGYDYSQAGLYFITINILRRKCLFGTIEHQEMILNDFGIIANQQWEKLPEQFTNIALDVFQVMPNHIHGILLLKDAAPVGVGLAPARDNTIPARETRVGTSPVPTKTTTVGNIVGAYKSQVANLCLKIFKQKHPGEIMGKLWQRNYYEHIVRDEQSFLRIADYITNNPSNWNEDRFYNNE
jgi:putative transposase